MRNFLCLLFLCSSIAWAQQNPYEATIQSIEIDAFAKAVLDKEIQLIDVRTPKEYQEGYIAAAQNIPIRKRKKFKREVQLLDKEAPVFIYCYSGVRSSRASKILHRLGFTKIIDFKGGWKAWTSR